MKSTFSTLYKAAVIVCLSIISFGCSSSGSSTSITPSTTTSVSGVVMAGPASGASITVKTADGTVVAGPVTTAADGSYSITIPNSALSGDLVFVASGGTFSDEATATSGVTMGTLTSHAAAGSLASGATVAIDPSSTIIQKLIAGGKSKAVAESTFLAAFGYTPDSTIKPVFAGMSSASTTPQRLAGLRAAAFSQLTMDLALAPGDQFALINAIAADLADGTLDGNYTVATKTIPADLCSKFGQALMNFQKSGGNKSKLTFDKIGAPPFAKKAVTASYIVEYLPGMMAATQGKTTFKIKLSNLDNSPATGISFTLIPKMYMASMSHSTPVDTIVESSTPGTYDCSVYYLMASGPGMGIWELKVMIGMETAIFYPPVAMAMGSTARATLKGVTDTIPAMAMAKVAKVSGMIMPTAPRTYYLFNEGVTGMGPYTFSLFIAASNDSMMMSFPAVFGGSTLNNAMGMSWLVNSGTSSVQVSSDGGVSWVTATDNGNGHWSAPGLTGLMAGGTVRVKVNINGEQKTTDGTAAVAGTNDFATFTIVAGM